MILTPLFFTLMYYETNWMLVYYFAAFVVSSCNLILLLISFFRDPKIAAEVISMIYSLSFFTYYAIDLDHLTCNISHRCRGQHLAHDAAAAQLRFGPDPRPASASDDDGLVGQNIDSVLSVEGV